MPKIKVKQVAEDQPPETEVTLSVEEFRTLLGLGPDEPVPDQRDNLMRLPDGSLYPGQILDKGKMTEMKVPWTPKAMRQIYESVTFVPYTNARVQVNGVVYYLRAMEEANVPAIIRDTYMQQLELERKLATHNNPSFIGVGPLSPED